MLDVEQLFYTPEGKNHPIEGYLSDAAKKDCKILFVLKEPNTGGYETRSEEFWMKRVIGPDPVELSDAYLDVLGTIARKLLDSEQVEKDGITIDQRKNALSKCAYINIYPFSGLGKEGERYKKTLKEMKAISQKVTDDLYQLSSSDEEAYKKIAMNRLQIIKNIKCEYVVVVCGAFEVIVGMSPSKCTKSCCEGITLEKYKKVFRVWKRFEKIIVSYYHPKARVDHTDMDLKKVICFHTEEREHKLI